MLRQQLEYLRDSSFVQRYHTRRTIQKDTVGRHSHGVAVLCNVLTEGKASAALLSTALIHDMPEFVVGDLTAPMKRGLPRDFKAHLDIMEEEALHENGYHYPGITEEEHRVLKVADYLEGLIFCQAEIEMGNTSIKYVANTYASYLSSIVSTEIEHAALKIIGGVGYV